MAQMQPPSSPPRLQPIQPAPPTAPDVPDTKFPLWGYFLIALDIVLLILLIWVLVNRLNPDPNSNWRLAWF